jgi:hypothetical protein
MSEPVGLARLLFGLFPFSIGIDTGDPEIFAMPARRPLSAAFRFSMAARLTRMTDPTFLSRKWRDGQQGDLKPAL